MPSEGEFIPALGAVPLVHPILTAPRLFLRHTCDIVTVCPKLSSCLFEVAQPSGHLYFTQASHKPHLLAKLDHTMHPCLSPPATSSSMPLLVLAPAALNTHPPSPRAIF